MKKEIGGYFELEHIKNKHYHDNAKRLNSARYCLQYILQEKKYKKIYIPLYICNSVLQPINTIGLNFEFYSIDKNFMPLLNKKIKEDEVMLYINYFGLKTKCVHTIKRKYKNVIIDNTQAFYSKPINNTDTIYSPRKFFGVSDGGYLYTDLSSDKKIKKDVSYKRYKYLLKRIDLGAEEGYNDFQKNEEELNDQEILEMSNLTSNILSSLDYKKIMNKRNENFKILHNKLKKMNEIEIDESLIDNGPMVYPLLLKNEVIREYLIQNKIYVATYWKDVLKRVNEDSFEYYLTNYLIPLPIDQRYDKEDMQYIAELIINKVNLLP